MDKEFLKSLGLEEGVAEKVLAEHEKITAKYTILENTITELKAQLKTRDKDLEYLRKENKGNGELQQQLESLQNEYKAKTETYEKQLNDMRFNHSLEKALTKAKAKNAAAVRALLNADKLKLNEDGTITGLEEQLKGIQESDGYLFDVELKGGTGSPGNFARKELKVEEKGLGERLAESVAVSQETESPYFK